MFQIQGGAYFRAELKCLAHKFEHLKVILSWPIENVLGVLLLCKISLAIILPYEIMCSQELQGVSKKSLQLENSR